MREAFHIWWSSINGVWYLITPVVGGVMTYRTVTRAFNWLASRGHAKGGEVPDELR